MHSIWIEFPATDLHRAIAFYQAVFGHESVDVIEEPTRAIAVLEGEPTVSLNQTEGFVPTTQGSLPYFHVPDMDRAVTAALANGGSVTEPRAERPGNGWFTLITDSEGNGLYLHSSD